MGAREGAAGPGLRMTPGVGMVFAGVVRVFGGRGPARMPRAQSAEADFVLFRRRVSNPSASNPSASNPSFLTRRSPIVDRNTQAASFVLSGAVRRCGASS